MSFLESSTNNMSAADLRGASVEKLRAKKRRVRYRNTNMALIGSPVRELPYYDITKEPTTTPHQNCLWNEHNKFKMRPRYNRVNNCPCVQCIRPITSSNRSNFSFQQNVQSQSSERYWKALNGADSEDIEYDLNREFERDSMDEVIYSFDRPTGPSHGSQILSQALGAAIDKMENKQLEKLVREEYDVIQTEDSSASEEDEEFELI